mgnify:CR=1 FL=1
MNIDIKEITNTFVYGTLDIATTDHLRDEISAEIASAEAEPGEIGPLDEEGLFEDARKSTLVWLEDCPTTFKTVLDLTKEINKDFFQLDMDDRIEMHQFTIYADPGAHYDWHQDHYEEDGPEDGFTRTVSISLCMSPTDFYEGAEFFIKDESETNIRVFKMGYGDFIIFPSTAEHRVNELREGERGSLVVWYGLWDK